MLSFQVCKTYTEKRIYIKTCRAAETNDTPGKRYGQILHLRCYVYGKPDGSVILMKKAASFENAVTFANAHKNDLKACIRVAEELNKNESVSYSPYLTFQLDAVARTLDAKLVFDDGIDTHEEIFKEADIRASKIIQLGADGY